MCRRALSLLFLIFCLLVVSCDKESRLPVSRAAEYEEKVLEAKQPLKITIDCDSCDLEVYRWIRKDIKFEYTKSVEGEILEEELNGKLKGFCTDIQTDEQAVVFKNRFKGSKRISGKLILRVYIPKKTNKFEFLCKEGKLRTYDNMNGELVIQADRLDAEINEFDGLLQCNINKGDFLLTDGKLLNGSKIATGQGNIRVKAEYEPSGTYHFISKEGLLDIFMPENLIANFTGDLPLNFIDDECFTDEYYIKKYTEKKYVNDDSDTGTVNFKLESGLDMVRITRF